jgi:hypothetical protein
MGMSYSHTLIPDRVDYVPHPRQVADFFSALVELGAAPRQAELVLKTEKEPLRRAGLLVTGRKRSSVNRSGQPVVEGSCMTAVDSIPSIGPALEGLDGYELRMRGTGPLTPLFRFDVELCPEDQSYDFEISCCLRPGVVSMSDYHHEVATIPEARTVVPFGETCNAANRTGFFVNHKTIELIRVPGAGYARFWIEFAFGKWVFPEMKDNSLDLLPANVVDAAQQIFEVRYAGLPLELNAGSASGPGPNYPCKRWRRMWTWHRRSLQCPM